MASTAVTCSLLLTQTSCSPKPGGLGFKALVPEETLKIGVTTDLLSFDPFSFQSLGERRIIDLIHGRLFTFSRQEVVSNYLSNLRIKKNKLVFSPMSDDLFFKLKKVFEKGKKSILWKSTFLQFDIHKNSITYKEDSDFIGQLKTLAPLLVFEGEGLYRVKKHVKGQSLLLEKNKRSGAEAKTLKTEKLFKNLVFLRIKDNHGGLKMVQSKNLDLYVPGDIFTKGLLESQENIEVVKFKNRFLKLRLYHKHEGGLSLNPLLKSFCENKAGLRKILGERWVLEKDSCEKSKEDEEPQDLYVVYSNKIALKILDFLFDKYKNSKGKAFKYEELQSTKLTEVLKKGIYDYYLNLEALSEETPVMFDSFHSKGRYNTYRLKDEELDRLLERAAAAESLKSFYKIKRKARERLFKIMPMVFSYKIPVVKHIKLKENKRFKLSEAGGLNFLKL